MITKIEKRRMNNMETDIYEAICPHCFLTVNPKYNSFFTLGDSNMRWCPKCFKGEAKIFWRWL